MKGFLLVAFAAALLASPCSAQSEAATDSSLLFVKPAGEGGPLIAYDTATGKRRFALPAGRASSDGTTFVALRALRETTVVTRYRAATGHVAGRSTLRGRWSLAGVSPTGAWIALTDGAARRGETRLAIARAGGRIAHRLALRGNFEVDTLSRDGKRLFLIQHLRSAGAPRYLVRLYDLTGQGLVADPLSAKGEDEVMAGLAWSGIGSPDGRWLLTLYLNTQRNAAFVHALDLDKSTAVCIDLPSAGSVDALKRYALTLSPDGRRLYATNPSLGAVAEIDLRSRRVVRTARFAGRRGGAATAPMGTISRNGRTLYFSGGRDLWAYDAAYGLVRGPYRTGARVIGLGYGSGDRRVHVVRADGRLLAFDAATGRALRG